MSRRFEIAVLPHHLGICRFPIGLALPAWCETCDFLCYVRSFESTTVLCNQDAIPAAVEAERDWSMLRIEGVFDFEQSGILAAVIGPLGAAEIPTLVVSTFETDYILVKVENQERAIAALRENSHRVRIVDE